MNLGWAQNYEGHWEKESCNPSEGNQSPYEHFGRIARPMSRPLTRDMPTWKAILLVAVSYGVLSIVLSFYPFFSPAALAFGILLTLISIFASAALSEDQVRWKGFLFANSWLLMFLGMAVRAWGGLLSGILIPAIVLAAFYILAWFIPLIDSSLSEQLYLSQVAPKTKAGRIMLGLLFAIAPSVAGVTAVVGYYGVGSLSHNATALILGVLASFVSIAGGQAVAHQLHRQ